MTWEQFHRRQRAIQAVLKYGCEHPSESLEPRAVPEARLIFGDSDELLAALQHKWTQKLIGRIEVAFTTTSDRPDVDRIDVIAAAWSRVATDNAILRDILDRHAGSTGPIFTAALERENHLLALVSGLADHGEAAAEISRVGAGLRRLLRVPAPRQPDRPRRTAGHR